MTAYQRTFVFALSTGIVIGMLIAFPASRRTMIKAQFERQSPHSPQALVLDSLAQQNLQTRVAGVILNVNHERQQIRMDVISPYPSGERNRITFTYSSSTTFTITSPEFIQLPGADRDVLREGARIMAIIPRFAGKLYASKIIVQP